MAPPSLAFGRPGHPSALLRVQTDARLLELARHGSEDAFSALVLRHRAALLRYARHLVGDDGAQDVVQDAFFRAHRALIEGSDLRDLRPWLFRVVHNRALDHLRDRARSHEQLDLAMRDPSDAVDVAVLRSERVRDVVGAVNGLPPRQREALILQALEGRSYDEIAGEMRVSGGSVRQLILRARATLRAGASAVTPWGLLARVPGSDPTTVAPRAVELAGGASMPVLAAQVCATTLITASTVAGALSVEMPRTDSARAAPVPAVTAAPARVAMATMPPSVSGRMPPHQRTANGLLETEAPLLDLHLPSLAPTSAPPPDPRIDVAALELPAAPPAGAPPPDAPRLPEQIAYNGGLDPKPSVPAEEPCAGSSRAGRRVLCTPVPPSPPSGAPPQSPAPAPQDPATRPSTPARPDSTPAVPPMAETEPSEGGDGAPAPGP